MGWTKRGVERIGKLTPSQEAQLFHFRDKWNQIAVSTEPFDVDAAIEGIKRFGKAWGVKTLGDKAYKTASPAAGWHAGGFHYEDLDKVVDYNAFSQLERSPHGTRCVTDFTEGTHPISTKGPTRFQ